MTSNNDQNNDLLFSEAPASWNTRYIDPNGFECQFTLRNDNGLELLEKANSAIKHLLKNDCQPYSYRGNNRTNNSKGQSNNAVICPIHDCEMRRWEKDGKVWYSHKVNGEWCNGK